MDAKTPVEQTVSGFRVVDSKATDQGTERHFRYWSPWLLLFAAVWLVGYCSVAQDPVALFEKNWVFIPVGFCGAVLGNISAVGGGIVFIPVIMFVFHFPPVTALKIALASQSWGMTSGAIGWLQKRVVPLRALKFTVPGLLIGSSISSLVIHPSALLVKLLFGPVSILLGHPDHCPLPKGHETQPRATEIPSERGVSPLYHFPASADLSPAGLPSVKANSSPRS